MENSVWKVSRPGWRYYIRHPLKYISDCIRSFKWVHQRALRGFADVDLYNMDHWMICVLAPMFDRLAKTHCGYPGEESGFTDETWTAYLEEISQHIRNASEDQTAQTNEFNDDWDKAMDWLRAEKQVFIDEVGTTHHVFPDLTSEQDALRNRYFQREKEIYEWRCNEIQTALNMIGKHFFALWD